jgi:DNA-binding phage protein
MPDVDAPVEQRFALLENCLDEPMRRLVTAAEAAVLGYGGISLVARAVGVSRRAITDRRELKAGASKTTRPGARIR